VDVGGKVLGVVLNQVNLRSPDFYYSYHSYSNYHSDSEFTTTAPRA